MLISYFVTATESFTVYHSLSSWTEVHVAVILHPVIGDVAIESIAYLTCWSPGDKARSCRLSEQEDHKGPGKGATLEDFECTLEHLLGQGAGKDRM